MALLNKYFNTGCKSPLTSAVQRLHVTLKIHTAIVSGSYAVYVAVVQGLLNYCNPGMYINTGDLAEIL